MTSNSWGSSSRKGLGNIPFRDKMDFWITMTKIRQTQTKTQFSAQSNKYRYERLWLLET